MSSVAPGPAESEPAPVGLAGESLARKCLRCGLAYAPAKSTSALRLTYCSFLCELGHLGFSITGLEHMERVPKPEEESPPAEE